MCNSGSEYGRRFNFFEILMNMRFQAEKNYYGTQRITFWLQEQNKTTEFKIRNKKRVIGFARVNLFITVRYFFNKSYD